MASVNVTSVFILYNISCAGLSAIVTIEVCEHSQGKGTSVALLNIEERKVARALYMLSLHVIWPKKITVLGDVGLSYSVALFCRIGACEHQPR